MVEIIKFKDKWLWNPRAYFVLSPHALALFRILFGLGIVQECVERLEMFARIHSSAGLFSLEFSERYIPHVAGALPQLPNIYFANYSDAFQMSLIGVQSVLGLLLILGLGGRWIMPFLIYLLCCSNLRMLFFLKGGDVMAPWIATLIFALPCWNVWTVGPSISKSHSTRAKTLAYMLLAVAIYFFSGSAKWHSSWRDGSALQNILMSSYMTLDFGFFLSRFPRFNEFVTPLVLPFETWGPFLLFLPSPLLRTLLCFSFVLFHCTLGLSLCLGNLTPFMSSIWIGLLPTQLFARWGRHPHQVSTRNPPLFRRYIAPLVILIAFISLSLANLSIYQNANLRFIASKVHSALLTFGVRGDMSFYRGSPSRKSWLRISATDADSNVLFYDLFGDRWVGKAHDLPPDNIFEETIRSRRFTGIFELLFSNYGHFYAEQTFNQVCRRTKVHLPEKPPISFVEATVYSMDIQKDYTYGPIKKRVLFSGDCLTNSLEYVGRRDGREF